MTDTLRTRSELISFFQDNPSGDISAQDMRDFLATVFLSTDSEINIGQFNSSDVGADGNGIKVHGGSDKSILYDYTNKSWTSSESFNLNVNKSYKIDGDVVLNKDTLGENVQRSYLTQVGTIVYGAWEASTIGVPWGGTGRDYLDAGSLLVGDGLYSVNSPSELTWDSVDKRLDLGGSLNISNQRQDRLVLKAKNVSSKNAKYSGSMVTNNASENTFFEFVIPQNIAMKIRVVFNGFGYNDINGINSISGVVEACYKNTLSKDDLANFYVYLVGDQSKFMNTDDENWDCNLRVEDGKVRLKVKGKGVNWTFDAETNNYEL